MSVILQAVPYLGGAAVTGLALWFLRPLAHRLGLVDQPGDRKIHSHDTPLIGGIAMFLGLGTILVILRPPFPGLLPFLTATGLLLLVGMADDFLELSVRLRFVMQTVAALAMAVWGGVSVQHLGDLLGVGWVALGGWSLPFTVICIVGLINAVNMIDGLDGLSGSLSLVSFLFLAGAAWQAGRGAETAVALAFVTVLIPFLAVNARLGRGNAMVFMGDAGSTFLGFALAWFTVLLTQGDSPALRPVTALWLVAVPLIDMFSAFLRRTLEKGRPFEPDRRHFHHVLLRRGLSVNGVVAVMAGGAILCAGAGLAADRLGVPDPWMFYGILVLFAVCHLLACRLWKRLERSGGRMP